MSFEQLDLKRKYRSASEELVKEFYMPVLENSILYQRAVGYFSSSILVDYIKALEKFIHNEGKMQLIISPFVTYEDAKSFIESTEQTEYIRNSVKDLFDKYKTNGKHAFSSAQLLLTLIKEKYLEVKIALPKDRKGIFHEKIGVFTDDLNNQIAINGSNNETDSAIEHNVESFNVFCSWRSGQEGYVEDHSIDFETYWNNADPTLLTIDLHDAVDEKIFIDFDTNKSIDELYLEVHEDPEDYEEPFSIQLRPFQMDAFEKWMKIRKGIFKFATGTGKTKTAIFLVNELYKLYTYLFVVIVVPDKTLVEQWAYELNNVGFKNIKCFSDNSDWATQVKNSIDLYKFHSNSLEIIIATKDTFSEERFQAQIRKIKNNSLFIADEVHRMGTDNLLSKLPEFIENRLGLSATPEIYFSQSRTERLFKYFGGILAEYNIDDAVKNGYLVGYNYYPIIVSLNEEEKEKYLQITHKIVKMLGFDDETKIKELSKEAELLLFQRARIIYGAKEKLHGLSLLLDKIESYNHLLIYCGATSINNENSDSLNEQWLNQLQSVNKLLNERGINAAQYTQDSNGMVRQISIESFRSGEISTLVAIRCLDEGINIEEIQQAIILASSGNPREFVQRRGRLLRPSPGKEFADIYDMVVYVEDDKFYASNNKELKRFIEFNSIALNKDKNETSFRKYLETYHELEENYGTN